MEINLEREFLNILCKCYDRKICQVLRDPYKRNTGENYDVFSNNKMSKLNKNLFSIHSAK